MLDKLLHKNRVIDIQCPEQLLPIAERLVRESKAVDVEARDRFFRRVEIGDKRTAMDLLHANGIRVPEHLDGTLATIDQAIDLYGLPLVVKPHRGSSGRGVVIARERETAYRAAEVLSSEGALFEEYVKGEQLGYCAVFRDGIVIQEGATERIRFEADSVRPTDSLRTLDDSQLFEIGRRVVTAIGGTGLVDLDILRDPFGRDYVIDVNLRAWTSIGALLSAGVDFADGYLTVIHSVHDQPPERRAAPGVEISFSLFLRGDGNGRVKISAAVVWFITASWHRIQDFGIRYWLNGLVTHVTVGFRDRSGA
jgi:hypothetical protein